MRDTSRVVGRLAPSPTGAQHIGNARTYLIAWLSARSQGGSLVLRIEDIDSPRVKQGAASQACHDLHWLGLDWDGEPVLQTQRLQLYEQALGRLRTAERIYPCTCSRRDVEQAASAPHADHEGPVYPGTCRRRTAAEALRMFGGPHAWRFRLEAGAKCFEDDFRGRTWIDLHEVGGDFVVWKSAGTPAYQLAVVVDDAAQCVTEVVRGDDLLPSTPRQLLLYEALDLAAPRYVHVPLVVGPDGRRLAKRHGDTRLSLLRARGVRPEALVGLLAWSCGWLDRIEAVAARELLSIYRLKSIPSGPFMLQAEHLAAIGLPGNSS